MILRIPLKHWPRMNCYAQLCSPDEVTGTGLLRKISNSELLVEEIFLPNQTASPDESDFTETGMHEIITDLITAGTPDKIEWLKFRWHSHAKSPCFYSPKDIRDIAKYSGDWVVNVVINAAGQYLARLDMFEPLVLRDLPIEVVIDYPIGEELLAECQAEIAEKVTSVRLEGR
ncbi:MAG: hypothetical protein ACK5MU_03245 [Candidatus Saccharimonadales bacterium]